MSFISRIVAGPCHDIQVSGFTEFPESRWKEAVLFYLFGVWGNRGRVAYHPKICFGDITLRLNQQCCQYYAYGHGEGVHEAIPLLSGDDLVEPSGKQTEVEVALIRFVKDERIRQIRLRMPSVSLVATLVLWKKERRGEYGCAGIGLPYAWGTKGPWWTREEFEREL